MSKVFNSVRRFFRIYMPFSSAGIKELLAYRVNFICFLIGEIMSSLVTFFLWKAVFTSSGESTFMGFTMSDMVVYIFLSFLTGYLTYSEGAYVLGEEIIDGSVSMRMIKPISFDMCFLFQEMGSNLIKISLIFLPIMACVEIYRFVVSGVFLFSIVNFLLYILSTLFAYLISFYFNICYGFLAFFLQDLWGVTLIKDVIINFLSGAIIPLAFLPPVLGKILNILPFASLSYTPVMIYMGKYDGMTIFLSILLQLFWLLSFYLLSRFIWSRAVKALQANGG